MKYGKYFSLTLASLALADSKPKYDKEAKTTIYSGGSDQKFTEDQHKHFLGEKKQSGRGRGTERGLDTTITKWPWSTVDDAYVINYFVDKDSYRDEYMVEEMLNNLKWVKNELARLNILLKDCEDPANCATARSANHAAFVKILNDDCYSYLGQTDEGLNNANGQKLGVGWCYQEKGGMLHEFMHLLGFVHEHQRPDRGSQLNIPELTKDSSDAEFAALGYESYDDWEANCGKFNDGALALSGTEYDTLSIMQYPKGGCGLKFKSNPDDDLAQRLRFSDLDKKEIRTQYPYLGSGTSGHHGKDPDHLDIDFEVINPNDCIRGNGLEYRGTVNTATVDGQTVYCQQWSDMDSYDWIGYCQKNYLRHQISDIEKITHNYCRNYDNDSKGTWCLTSQSSVSWASCDIPRCEGEPEPTLNPPAIDYSPLCNYGDGSAYRGSHSSGHQPWDGLAMAECAKWTDYENIANLGSWMTDYIRDKIPEWYSKTGDDLDHNYCRNIDGESRTWCLTHHPESRGGWLWCDHVPECGYVTEAPKESGTAPPTPAPVPAGVCKYPEQGCEAVDHSQTCKESYGNGLEYRGTLSVAKNGKECLPWDSYESYEYLREQLFGNHIRWHFKDWITRKPEIGGMPQHNHCRNYDQDMRGPWCLVRMVDNKVHHKRCDVNYCKLS